jgi:hypothetical protein
VERSHAQSFPPVALEPPQTKGALLLGFPIWEDILWVLGM